MMPGGVPALVATAAAVGAKRHAGAVCNSLSGVWNAAPTAGSTDPPLVRIIQANPAGELTAAWWLPNPTSNESGVRSHYRRFFFPLLHSARRVKSRSVSNRGGSKMCYIFEFLSLMFEYQKEAHTIGRCIFPHYNIVDFYYVFFLRLYTVSCPMYCNVNSTPGHSQAWLVNNISSAIRSGCRGEVCCRPEARAR